MKKNIFLIGIFCCFCLIANSQPIVPPSQNYGCMVQGGLKPTYQSFTGNTGSPSLPTFQAIPGSNQYSDWVVDEIKYRCVKWNPVSASVNNCRWVTSTGNGRGQYGYFTGQLVCPVPIDDDFYFVIFICGIGAACFIRQKIILKLDLM